jgi:hypothetical protein
MTRNSVSFYDPFLSKKVFELHVKVGAVLDQLETLSVALVRKRTIPTERPPLSAK